MGYALPIEQDKKELDILWWAGSICLLGLGIYVATASWIAGLILIGFAVLISPYAYTKILEKLKLTDKFHARVLIVFFALVWSTYVLDVHTKMIATKQEAQVEFEAQQALQRADQQRIDAEKARVEGLRQNYAGSKEKVLSDFSAAIDARDLGKASALHNEYAPIINDQEFVAVDTRYKALQVSIEQAQKEQARLDRIAVLQGQIKTLTATDYSNAITIYGELVKLDSVNSSYKQSLERFTKAQAVATYVLLIRNIPLLVLVLLVYFALPQTGIRLDKYESFIGSLALYAGAYLTEVFRAGLLSVPKGIVEAGRAIGLTRMQTNISVVMPVMLRNSLPSLGNTFIGMFKDSSIAAAIAIPELTFEARKINVDTFRVVETWTVASGLYIATCFTIADLLRMLERRFPKF